MTSNLQKQSDVRMTPATMESADNDCSPQSVVVTMSASLESSPPETQELSGNVSPGEISSPPTPQNSRNHGCHSEQNEMSSLICGSLGNIDSSLQEMLE